MLSYNLINVYISWKKGGVFLAAIDSAYHYYLSTYGTSKVSRYDTHKKSQLRAVYNQIVKTNKDTPLYKIPDSTDVKKFAIDLKEHTRSIQNVIAALSDNVAGMLAKSTSFKHIVLSAIMAGLHVIILVLSTDLGSALIYFMIYVFMVYVGTHKARYLVLGFAGFSVASLVAYKLFSHVQTRVVAWKDPWSTISGAGYQVAHSLFALGNGGFTGTGLYQGKPNYVPEVEQDFIFSAVGEEFGAVFGMLLILVCLTCFIVFLVTAMQQINTFNKLVCVGLGIQYAFQIILTVGGAIKMIPSTGVTLPLLSYGGSSIISTLIVFAIIQGLSIVGATQVPVRKKKAVEDRKNVKARNTAKISGLENTQEIKINSKR